MLCFRLPVQLDAIHPPHSIHNRSCVKVDRILEHSTGSLLSARFLSVRNFSVKLVDLPPHLPNFVFAFRDEFLNALCGMHRDTKHLRFERLVQRNLHARVSYS
jgi:hypothetical protein